VRPASGHRGGLTFKPRSAEINFVANICMVSEIMSCHQDVAAILIGDSFQIKRYSPKDTHFSKSGFRSITSIAELLSFSSE
jgi:hypothetical protein